MHTLAVVLHAPERLALDRLQLDEPGEGDVVVDIAFSGISTGTERLLWSGRMPPFPGLGYPLVPGYESVGRVVSADKGASLSEGDTVFVPGAKCFGDVRGLFGGAAARVVVPADRLTAIDAGLGDSGVLLALAATGHHAVAAALPDLIVGHGVLGRLIARLVLAMGGEPPTVWEKNPARHGGAEGYAVVDPATDSRRDYRTILDASGDAGLLDTLIARLSRGGEIVLAGFYEAPLTFAFPPAFMREARLRIAAEWKPVDLAAVMALVDSGRLSLDGLVTHRESATRCDDAYRTAFADPGCLKMVLDWRGCS